MTHTTAITARLDQQLNVIRTWLAPAVEDQMARPDAAKLRVLVANLTEIRDAVAGIEEGIPAATEPALSETLEAMADLFAANPGGLAFPRTEIVHYVALLNAAAATAWAYELAARLRGGLALPEDLAVLRVAKALSRKGVTAGMPAPDGGHAA